MARTAVETIDYPESDGLPMAESEFQFWPILYAGSALAHHYRGRDDVYVVGNLLVYYEPPSDKPGASVAPDLMVVFGVPAHARRSYVVWREGKGPDFVLEVASSSTWRADRGGKRSTYAGMGVSEYWRYDPTGEYLDPRLQGLRLVDGRYEPVSVAAGADGSLAGYSEVLSLELRLYPDDRFRFHDPVAGGDLPSLEEEAQARQEAEAARQQEAQARQEAEAARKALEAELRALRARMEGGAT